MVKKVLKMAGWCLLGVFVLYTFYFLWKQSQPAPVVYELIKPEQRDIVKKTVATGSVEARNQVEVKPQATGIISQRVQISITNTDKAGTTTIMIPGRRQKSLLLLRKRFPSAVSRGSRWTSCRPECMAGSLQRESGRKILS